jgi:hypothetical protein
MNKGEIRILIGSTEKAGTGLNVQRRMVAMHHLDIPWKPSELEQRNGRGARQGNIVAKEHYGNQVKNYIYAVEQTLDNYKFNLLRNKQTFISQMKNCSLQVRTIDEGSMDEKSGMNFSEYIAILSGDTTLLEKSKLDKRVAVLESLRSAHFKELSRTRYRLESMLTKRDKLVSIITKLTFDESFYYDRLLYDKDQAKVNPLQLTQLSSAEPEAIGNYLIQLFKTYQSPEAKTEEKIGSLYGFDCYIRGERDYQYRDGEKVYYFKNSLFVQHPDTQFKYHYNDGQPNIDNPKLAARIFLNAIDRVAAIKEQETKELNNLLRDIPMLQELILVPFQKEAELQKLKAEQSALDRQISQNIKDTKLKMVEAVEAVKTILETPLTNAMEVTAPPVHAGYPVHADDAVLLRKSLPVLPNVHFVRMDSGGGIKH